MCVGRGAVTGHESLHRNESERNLGGWFLHRTVFSAMCSLKRPPQVSALTARSEGTCVRASPRDGAHTWLPSWVSIIQWFSLALSGLKLRVMAAQLGVSPFSCSLIYVKLLPPTNCIYPTESEGWHISSVTTDQLLIYIRGFH